MKGNPPTGLGALVFAALALATAVPSQAAASARDVASCGEAALGEPDDGWRKESAVAGRFGLYGPARDLRGPEIIRRDNGLFGAKLPAIIEGTDPVVLSVPNRWLGRVAIDFGDLYTAKSLSQAHDRVTFRPCSKRDATGWPGGLIFNTRKSFELEVQVIG